MINLKAEDKKWVDGIWEKLDAKLSETAKKVVDFVPYSTENGRYICPRREGIT